MSKRKFISSPIGKSRSLHAKNYQAKTPNSTETEPNKITTLAKLGVVAPWGTKNDFPTFLDKQLENSIDMESGFQTLTEFTYGLRIATYIEEMEGKTPIRRQVYNDQFEEFKENYNFNEVYLQRAFYNFFRYANTFIELSFENGKIDRIFTKDSPFCRISTLDKKKGLSEWMYQSAQWGTNFRIDDEKTLQKYISDGLLSRIPLIDYRNPIKFIQDRGNKNVLLGWHIKDYSPGDPYYGKSPWYPILTNGWLDIASSAPDLLKSYYQNLITIARQVDINIGFFEDTIEGWSSLEPSAQKKALVELQESIEENLTGSDKAFKTLFTQSRLVNGQQESMYKITSIDNPIKDNSVINDLQYSASMVNTALRIDPSIIGAKTDGSLESDAGSEKRTANNLLHQRLSMVRDQILYPLTILKKINGWDPKLKFNIEVQYQQTTDVAKTGQTTVTP